MGNENARLAGLTVFPPDAIFVLSGGIVRTIHGGFRSTSYRDLDFHGFCTAGKTRVIAAAQLGRVHQKAVLVTTSRVEPDFPSHASVMATELIRYGIPLGRILLEEQSVNTQTELIEMVKLATRNRWGHIAVLTNAYHLARVRAMIELFSGLCESKWPQTVVLVAAENVLRLRSPHYTRLIAAAESTEAFRGRIEAEKRGLRQLREGTYQSKLS
jgi:hypothetical protein